MSTDLDTVAKKKAKPLLALIPLALLAALVAVFVAVGPRGVFPGDFPPVEELTIQRVTFFPEGMKLTVTNGGPSPVQIAQVLVDEAYWEHTVEPSRTLNRLDSAVVTIPYPWVEGDPLEVVLISSTGVTFSKEVDVSTESPAADGRFLVTFLLLGLYIGVIPVALGMTWLPFLRTLSPRWTWFFMAFTAGVLAFLGVEALAESFEEAESMPEAFGGVGLVVATAISAFALIYAGNQVLRRRGGGSRVIIAYAVAAGIGLHNMGEGLAVGAAYRLGEIGLGAFLVIGFAVHNTTEGLGIVSIIGERKTSLRQLAALGLIAGAPTILGGYVGALVFSPLLATVFLSVAAGAIAEVIVEVMGVVRRDASGGLTSIESLAGITAGLLVMYLTAILVAG